MDETPINQYAIDWLIGSYFRRIVKAEQEGKRGKVQALQH